MPRRAPKAEPADAAPPAPARRDAVPPSFLGVLAAAPAAAEQIVADLHGKNRKALVATHPALRAAAHASTRKVMAQLNRKGDRADGAALAAALSDMSSLVELVQHQRDDGQP
jgi:hypothetical protein